MTPEEIVSTLTLEQKAAQMLQPAVYNINESAMKGKCYGSVVSKAECLKFDEWQETVDRLQSAALESEAGIPYIYGQDDVHGVNYCDGAVIFPHNIGAGAANDPELMYQVGLATADEAKLCHMLWNLAPCLAQSEDPRWGRTYESYGADLNIISELGASYTKGLIDGGAVACAKHFFADGNVEYGTGEDSNVDRLIDRGDAILTDQEIDKLLDVYQAQIDAGVQTIMISHSSLNGVKMHENAKYIKYLKEEMGFDGMIVSDWNSVQNTSASSYKDQLTNSINAGIDMLMEVDKFDSAIGAIVAATQAGDISQERIDDAVTRIIKVKMDAGLFLDPMLEKMKTKQQETGAQEYRDLAEKLVEESLVLLKNDGGLLPLKEGMKVYVMGPAATADEVQCGGWTVDWNGAGNNTVSGVTTILDGLRHLGKETGIEFTANPSDAKDADAVIAVLGEQPYAEWNGDTEDMDLCGSLGLTGNKKAIEEVKKLGKPSIACILAGRQVLISDYMDAFDSMVMCYLPGSEGQGVANVLCGQAEFTGKLPSPWYANADQIGTDECMFEQGYGLTY